MKRIGIGFIFVLLICMSSFVSYASEAANTVSFTINPVQNQAGPNTVDLSSPEEAAVLHVSTKPLLTSDDFSSAAVFSKKGRSVLRLTLREAGALRLRDFSKANVGEKLAVVVDHKLLGAPVIRVPINGARLQVDAFDSDQANELARIINGHAVK